MHLRFPHRSCFGVLRSAVGGSFGKGEDMGRLLRGWALFGLIVVGMICTTGLARPTEHEGWAFTAASSTERPAHELRGALPGRARVDTPANASPRGNGPPFTPPGCARSPRALSVEDAFDVALQRWIRSAENVYRNQYSDLRYIYDLDYTVSGRFAEGEVEWEASVFDHALGERVPAGGVLDVRFALLGCSWRLVWFRY